MANEQQKPKRQQQVHDPQRGRQTKLGQQQQGGQGKARGKARRQQGGHDKPGRSGQQGGMDRGR